METNRAYPNDIDITIENEYNYRGNISKVNETLWLMLKLDACAIKR